MDGERKLKKIKVLCLITGKDSILVSILCVFFCDSRWLHEAIDCWFKQFQVWQRDIYSLVNVSQFHVT